MTLGSVAGPVRDKRLARKRSEKRSLIVDGGDPTVESDSDKATFGALAIRYVEYVRAHGKKSWERDATRLGVAVDETVKSESENKVKTRAAHFTPWHTRRLDDIGRNDVVQLHESIGKQHGKYAGESHRYPAAGDVQSRDPTSSGYSLARIQRRGSSCLRRRSASGSYRPTSCRR